MNSIIWLVVFLVLLFIEIATMGLTTIWFAIGSIFAFILSLFVDNAVLELAVGVGVSLIALIFTRPLFVKFLEKDQTKTNVDEIVGKTVIVTKAINDSEAFGEAKIGGDTWMAKSEGGVQFKEGEKAIVKRVEGVKLILAKKN